MLSGKFAMTGVELEMGDRAAGTIRFESFLVDLDAVEIRRNGEAVQVEPQVFDIIVLLCANPGRVVGHDEIIETVWHGRIVSDSAIATRINAARKALGDDGTAQKIIKTVRGRGFRLEVTPLVDHTTGQDFRAVEADERFVLSCSPLTCSLLMTTRSGEDAPQVWRHALPDILARAAAQHSVLESAQHTAVFASAVDALRCAVAVLQAVSEHCRNAPTADQWTAKIGIGHGVISDKTAYARANRLDAAAPPGALCITGRVMDLVAGEVDLDVDVLPKDTVFGGQDAFKVTRIEDQVLADQSGAHVPQTAGLTIPEPAEVSVVVLPFEVVRGDSEVEDAAIGLRLEIQNALAQLSGVMPMAAGTAMAFAGSTSPETAEALGVRYVVQGNVRAIGRRIRLMIELYDHRRGGVTFAHTYDGSLDEGFDFQDGMTAQVVAALDVKVLSGEQARVWHKSYRDLKVIRLQYRGMSEFFRMRKEAMRAARDCFEQLHGMRPDISIGSTWVSLCHWFELQRGWTDDRDVSIAAVKKWANIAIGMEDADGQAHTALCHAHMMERDFDRALEVGRNAITIRPSCANANGFYAHALYYCGMLDKAVHHVRLAIRFSPAYPPLFAVILSGALHAQGDQQAAIPVALETLRLATGDPMVRVILISALMEAGRQLEASAVAQDMLEADAQFRIDPFLERMPFRQREMQEQLSRNFTRALDASPG